MFAISRWVLEFSEVEYYDPQTLADVSAVILQTAAGVTTGVALLFLWRNPPVRRGSVLILIGGVAAIGQGLGNLFEDAFGFSWGEWGFFVGGIGMVFSLAGAGILALSAKSPHRLSGAFLLAGATGGMLGFGLVVMGLAWFGLSRWMVRRISRVEPAPIASV